tara:strand:+ start:53296 stop:53883 length:588 start_codon:yes stop_codon:yes gene_type:complete
MMGRQRETIVPAYFERMFQNDPDPWNLASSPYEAEKFSATIAALGDCHFRSTFEVGCAGGMLTSMLAGHCCQLLAVDVSETALKRARKQCHGLPNVDFATMQFPRQAPSANGFDLVVLSEVAYYWDDADITRAADWLAGLLPHSVILLVHYILETDYPQTGDEAVEKLRSALGDGFRTCRGDRHEKYRLDLWLKN